MNELLHDEEERAYGDSATSEKRNTLMLSKNKSGKNIPYIVNLHPSFIKKLSKSGQYATKTKRTSKIIYPLKS